jgi:hypothetical protein
VTASRGASESSERRNGTADDECEVVALDRAVPHERLQPPVRFLRARDDHQPGGVAVEPVHDPRPVRVAARDVVPEEAVHERPGPVAGRGVHDDSRGLVDDEEVLVLPRDPQRHVLRDERARARRGQVELDLLTARQPVALRACVPVDADRTALEERSRAPA